MNEREIVLAALEIESPEDRMQYVAQACRQNQELAQRVEHLLRASESVGSFLESPAPALLDIVQPESQDEMGDPPAPGTSEKTRVLGDFRIRREIGRGGMGVVYEAEQISLGRHVALKVLPFAAMVDNKQLRRFKIEAQAAAQLHHTNIVPVYAVGSDRGVHFYAMQFIEGHTIAELIEALQDQEHRKHTAKQSNGRAAPSRRTTSPRSDRDEEIRAPDDTTSAEDRSTTGRSSRTHQTDREMQAAISTVRSTKTTAYCRSVAQLGVQVAEALDYAHEEGVIHRDIKPSNLIVDGKGKIWVMDFGLARIASEPGLTMTGDMLGTLRYMSPEQALAKRVLVDHRADIYSLGVTLYEMLVLQPAFPGRDREEVLRQIAFDDPKPPRRINRHVPFELETIVLKAMAKNPVERYGTVGELAEDLRRYLDDRPIQARRPTWAQRVIKWSKRHKAIVVAAAIILVLTTIGLGVSNVFIAEQRAQAVAAGKKATRERSEAQRQRDRAKIEQAKALQNLYLAEMRQAGHDWSDGPMSRVRDNLLRYVPTRNGTDLRQWEWYYFRSLLTGDLLDVRGKGPPSISWTPDGKQLVTAGGGEFATVWDALTRQPIRTLYGHTARVNSVCVDPTGTIIATGSHDKTIKMWDAASGRELGTLEGGDDDDGVWWIGWSPDGSKLASVSGYGIMKLWDVAEKRALFYVSVERPSQKTAAWSPDGRRIALSGQASQITVLDTANGRTLQNLIHEPVCLSIAWHPDSRRLATSAASSGIKPAVKVWDVESGEVLHAFPGADVPQVAWHPSGDRLAAAHWGSQTISIWDAESGKTIHGLSGHQGAIESLAWSHDGTRVASGSRDQTIRIWNADSGEELQTLRGHTSGVWRLEFSPDDHHLVSWGDELKIWKVDKDPLIVLGDGRIEVKASVPNGDGQRIASFRNKQTIDVWDSTSGQQLRSLSLSEENAFGGEFTSAKERKLAWSHDGRYIAWPAKNGFRVWDLSTNDQIRAIGADANAPMLVAWNADGRSIASADDTRTGRDHLQNHITIWDVETGRPSIRFAAHDSQITAMAWSRRWLASASWDGTVRIWDPTSGELLHLLEGHQKWIAALAWSPDGRQLASGGHDHDIRIWNAVSGELLHMMSGHPSRVYSLAWHPHGPRLASSGADATVRIWDTVSGQELVVLKPGADFTVGWLAWSGDGHRLSSASNKGSVRTWDASEGHAVAAGRTSTWEATSDQVQPVDADRRKQLVAAMNYHNAGLRAMESGNVGDAIRWYRKEKELREKIASRRTDVAAWTRLGQAFYRAGQWDDAREVLEKSIELRGDQLPTVKGGPRWWFLTMTLARLGEKEQAQSYFDRLVEQMGPDESLSESDARLRSEAAELLEVAGEAHPVP